MLASLSHGLNLGRNQDEIWDTRIKSGKPIFPWETVEQVAVHWFHTGVRVLEEPASPLTQNGPSFPLLYHSACNQNA